MIRFRSGALITLLVQGPLHVEKSGILHPVHRYKQCHVFAIYSCDIDVQYTWAITSRYAIISSVGCIAYDRCDDPASQVIFMSKCTMNLSLFYCLNPSASIVSMFRRSVLQCVRFQSVTLDIEGSGRFFHRSHAKFIW